MALSNIFIEPRREITETVVGLGVSAIPIGLFSVGAYFIALSITDNVPFPLKLFLAALTLAIGLFIVVALTAGFFALTHAIGDSVCDLLEERGFQVRPKERYRRNYRGEIERVN